MAFKRIQRKRTKGWRMPLNTVYVGRPTRYGNPFRFRRSGAYTREWAAEQYRSWIRTMPFLLADIKRELRGKDLACWCPLDEPCHADVLLELANKESA